MCCNSNRFYDIKNNSCIKSNKHLIIINGKYLIYLQRTHICYLLSICLPALRHFSRKIRKVHKKSIRRFHIRDPYKILYLFIYLFIYLFNGQMPFFYNIHIKHKIHISHNIMRNEFWPKFEHTVPN